MDKLPCNQISQAVRFSAVLRVKGSLTLDILLHDGTTSAAAMLGFVYLRFLATHIQLSVLSYCCRQLRRNKVKFSCTV